jgi:hypothetical protein
VGARVRERRAPKVIGPHLGPGATWEDVRVPQYGPTGKIGQNPNISYCYWNHRSWTHIGESD